MLSGTSASRSRSGAASTRAREVLGEVEVALHDRAVALAAVRAQRRPDRERPRPPRHLRPQVPPVRLRVVEIGQVRGAAAEHRGLQRGVAHEREPRLVRHVQPLVAVGDHRVGPLEPFDEMRGALGQRREQPERAVDVQPRAVALGQVGHRAAADRSRRRSPRRRSRSRPPARRRAPAARARAPRVEPADRVAGELPHGRAPDPEHRERLHVARMHVARPEHRHRREDPTTPCSSMSTPCCRRPPPAGARERDEVRHRGAGREHAAPLGGSPKSSFSQRSETSSSCPASGEATHAPGFWSSAVATSRHRAPPAWPRR